MSETKPEAIEVETLKQEVADLASELNELNNLRLIRLFHRYRRLRYHLAEKLSRFLIGNSKGPKAFYGAAQSKKHDDHRYDVIFFSCENWQWRHQRPQHLAKQWVDHGQRVFFISPHFESEANPSYNNKGQNYRSSIIKNRLIEVHLAGSKRILPNNRRMLASDVVDLTKAVEHLREDFNIGRAISVLESPFWTPLAFALREKWGWKVIYDFIDRWYGIHPKSHSMLMEEPRLLREANLVVATARLLMDEAKKVNENVFLIPNGCECEHFRKAIDIKKSNDRKKESQNAIIGYIGNLAPWFDVELIACIAERNPKWRFQLIGSGSMNKKPLENLENIQFLGEIPYKQLPEYLADISVCIIPFKLLPVTATTDPVKFYEYLSAGKPVVSTHLPELKPYENMVYTAKNTGEFEQQIQRALVENSEVKELERTEFAEAHSWQNRYRDYDQAICSLLGISEKSPQNKEEQNKESFLGAVPPRIITINPSAIRVEESFESKHNPHREMFVTGDSFSSECIVLIDEVPVNTDFINTTELRCLIPKQHFSTPECHMVSVIDKGTWMQSNRRALLVQSV